LFISHSNKDTIAALAFQRWLIDKGWGEDDVFIDLHGIGAGENWREALVKANVACDALLYLASPESLDSEECRREVRRAEDDRKDVIVAILRDLRIDDPRLKPWTDRQVMDLSADPREERIEVEHQSRRHLLDFNHLALEAIHAKLIEWGHAPDSFAWPPKELPNAQPYPGLDAFDELSAGIFFGREADIMSGIRDLRQMRHRGSPRLMVIQGASGTGKSSFLRAGLWPKLGRTVEFVPLAIVRSAKGVITGPQGLGKGFEDWFGRHWIRQAAGQFNTELTAGDETAGAARLAGFMGEAARLVTEARSLASKDARRRARPSVLIAIDQGEELFAAEDAGESERFIAMLGHLLAHPPEGLDPYALITIRADSVDPLLQRVPNLGIAPPHLLPLTPLSPSAYRDVITRPAAVYSRRIARLDFEPDLVAELVGKATGADALPLLAFTLQRLFDTWHKKQRLTVEDYTAMGGIEGSIDRALAEDAGAVGSMENFRRLLIPALATWDPEAGAAKRLVPKEADIVVGDRAVLAPLANALVQRRLLTRSRDTIEVAHEALLRRKPICDWLEAHKGSLKLRDDVLKEAKDWIDGGRHDKDLVRRGERLASALALQAHEDYKAPLKPAADYLAASERLEAVGKRKERRTIAALFALMAGIIAALVVVIYKEPLAKFWVQQTTERLFIANEVRVLTAEREQALESGEVFHECTKGCPEMVVIPAGTFQMGSPETEQGRRKDEGPVHTVTIRQRFAVGKFEVTWDEWEACVKMRGCDGKSTGDAGRKPVANVSWSQAKAYVDWLARITRKRYRLLTEAEWEYAARGITSADAPHPPYPWGDDPAEACRHANLADESYRRGGGQTEIATDCNDGHAYTAHVGSFPPNAFALNDMHGNVWEWVEDNWHPDYTDAPTDGAVWTGGDSSRRVLRGGSWASVPRSLRSALRFRFQPDGLGDDIGFRVARSLQPAGQ
jgi:formylglycine-generating enzyme required for sulfatase activity